MFGKWNFVGMAQGRRIYTNGLAIREHIIYVEY